MTLVYSNETMGYEWPERLPEHEDSEWYQRDLDDPFTHPDDPDPPDRLPTLRHRRLPDPPA